MTKIVWLQLYDIALIIKFITSHTQHFLVCWELQFHSHYYIIGYYSHMFYIQFLNLVFSSNRNYLSFDQDVPNLSPATDNHHPALWVQRFIIHKDGSLDWPIFSCVELC
jgi:hypothetical protein